MWTPWWWVDMGSCQSFVPQKAHHRRPDTLSPCTEIECIDEKSMEPPSFAWSIFFREWGWMRHQCSWHGIPPGWLLVQTLDPLLWYHVLDVVSCHMPRSLKKWVSGRSPEFPTFSTWSKGIYWEKPLCQLGLAAQWSPWCWLLHLKDVNTH